MGRVYRNVTSCARVESEQGVTVIEYALIASLLSIVIVTAKGLIGSNLSAIFDYIAGQLTAP